MSTAASLEEVFKKWEKKGEERRLNPSKTFVRKEDNVVQAGRAAWTQRFDSGSMPKRKPPRRKKQAFDENCLPWSSAVPIETKFQLTAPLVKNPLRSSRQFLTTGCPRCAQKSQMMFLSDKAKLGPLCNLLDLSVFCRKNMFRNALGNLAYVNKLSWPANQKTLYNINKTILKSPKVKSTIERLSNDSKPPDSGIDVVDSLQISKELELQGKTIITTMSSCIKSSLIKLSTWFLLKFFGKVMTSIQIHEGQIAMLQKADKQNVPIVYLPLHKSHVDYVLISFILSCRNIKVPYIVAGDNLKDIPFFSWLMRNMGGFFIKRANGDLHKPQNELYKVIFDEYMTQILESGNSLEVYIEGTRSRSGKCYLPKVGVLSTIVSNVLEGRISDVLIIPVNISYEKILENGYSDELLGRPKKTESFLQIVTGIWRIFNNNYGQVSVNFGLPSSLTEYIRVAETSEVCQNFIKTTAARSSPCLTLEKHGQIRTVSSEISLDSSITFDNSVMSLTKSVAHHVIYDCVYTSTIMSTNMLAFLLLTKFRKGVTLKDLEAALESLKNDILLRKRDYGFSGSNKAVILHALNILGNDLVSLDPNTCIVQPNLSLPGVLQLSYHANQVLSVFALESIIACSICALLADENITLPELVYNDLTISRRELLDTGLDLCDLLCREFVFTPPCVSLETSLLDTIERFVASDVISVCEDQGAKSRERQWANRIAVSTGWSDDDDGDNDAEIGLVDEEYKVNASEEGVKKLAFLCSVLSPIIESYWFVACSIFSFHKQNLTENEFIKEIHKAAIRRVENGTALYSESCSLVSVTNAVKVFEMCNILRTNGKEGSLHLVVDDEDTVISLLDQISRYKM